MPVANNATVKERTGLSARKMKATPNDWLSTHPDEEGKGVSLMAQTYVGRRYVELQAYDYEAPSDRAWIITMIDRQTGASVTLVGGGQRETTSRALKQIGALDKGKG